MKKIYKITDEEAIACCRKMLKKREDGNFFGAEIVKGTMEICITIAIDKGEAKVVKHKMDYSKDYEYFINEKNPYILARR